MVLLEHIFRGLEVHLPDGQRGRLVERRVVEAEVDPGAEGLVDGADTVGGQEEDAAVVFEHTQEDGDDGVAAEVVFGALLEEDAAAGMWLVGELLDQKDDLTRLRREGGHSPTCEPDGMSSRGSIPLRRPFRRCPRT